MTVNEFWNLFLKKTNKPYNTKYIESFHFEATEVLANKLLKLVLSGEKQATASSLYVYEIDGNRMPQIGDYNIVTDWSGNPRCVIVTTCVTILPFKDMSYEICKREGEDDSLDSWKKNHTSFFTNDGERMGYDFSDEMPVVFEDFKVVFVE